MSNNTLYKAYLERKKENKERKEILKKYDISDDEKTVIINKKSKIHVLIFLWDILSKILKIVLYITIVLLVTIGATVLLNTELREFLINFLQ